MSTDLAFYGTLLADIKTRIRHAQNRAALAVNAELVRLCWDIGRLILARQQQEGWGAGVIPRLARDLHNELPELKVFSDRNIKRMVQFAREYPGLFSIGPRAVAQLADVPKDPKRGPLPVAQSNAPGIENDFYVDLLFYHLRLRAFIVVELKRGQFKPGYAVKMNFYCSVVEDKLRHKSDEPSIGLNLCQTKDRFIAEYALRDIHNPIGVADYELTRALPEKLASSRPSIEQIEAELQSELDRDREGEA